MKSPSRFFFALTGAVGVLATGVFPTLAASVGGASFTAASHTVLLTSQAKTTLIGVGTAPVSEGGLVFVTAVRSHIPNGSTGPASYIYAFDRQLKLRWRYPFAVFPTTPPSPTTLTPASVRNGVVYVGWNQIGPDQYDGTTLALAATTGAQIFSNGEGGTSAAAVAGGSLYSNWQFTCCFGEHAEGTQALDTTTGAPIFTTYLNLGSPTSAPLAAGGFLYVASGSTLDVFDATGHNGCVPGPGLPRPPWRFPVYCAPLWSASFGGAVTGTPVVAGTEVYIGASDHTLYALPALGCGTSTCSPDWTATTNGALSTSLVASRTTIFVTSASGTLYAYPVGGCSHSTCGALWTASVGGVLTAPILSGRFVFFGSSNDNVYAFKSAGCGKVSCTPSYRANAGAPVASTPAVAVGHLFVSDTGRVLHSFRLP